MSVSFYMYIMYLFNLRTKRPCNFGNTLSTHIKSSNLFRDRLSYAF